MTNRILLALLLTSAVAPVSAQQPALNDSTLDARAEELAAVLRCPVCQGLSLADSPSELSQQMKDVVKDQLRQGKSNEEVKAYFVSKYGEWILLEPKPQGMNLIVYLSPLLVLLGGGTFIVVMVRRWTRLPESTALLQDEDIELEDATQGPPAR